MISDHCCFYCFTRAFEKLIKKADISIEAKNSFTLEMINLYSNKWNELMSPEFSRELHVILKSYTHNPDPYRQEKKENNDQALKMSSDLEKMIQRSNDPFNTAMRLAIAGNIIDFAASDTFNLQSTIDSALHVELAIDHSVLLKNKIVKAKSVLYLGDNAGEIVFDKLFIETINHPNMIYVVRGGPVINDATIEDAEYIGMKSAAMEFCCLQCIFLINNKATLYNQIIILRQSVRLMKDLYKELEKDVRYIEGLKSCFNCGVC